MASVTRSVALPSAPSHTSAFGAWPVLWRHGWKWSDTATVSKPSPSAWREYSSSSRGPNCSADALYPIRKLVMLAKLSNKR